MTLASTLSVRIREESAQAHAEAEASPLMTALVNGRLTREQYAGLLGQLQHVYAAIDAGASELHGDPTVGSLLDPRLDRTEAISADLAALGATSAAPTVATRSYVDRIREVADTWPVGFVAHHYTRYLGDLSGGMVVARSLATSLGLTPTAGLAFFQFDVGPTPTFKREYRHKIDELALSEAEAQGFFDEARRAFRLNLALFDSLLAAP